MSDYISKLARSRSGTAARLDEETNISGWKFSVNQREGIELSADITDHAIESGSFIHDHVVNKPVRITLSGFVGELVYEGPGPIGAALESMQGAAGALPGMLGPFSPQALNGVTQTIAKANQVVQRVESYISTAKNAIDKIKSGGKTAQARAFLELENSWKLKDVMTVQTPWQFYDRMMIESISITQEEDSDEISDIAVTLKQITVARVEETDFSADSFFNSNQIQKATAQENGLVDGVAKNRDSVLFQIAGEQ